MKLKIFLLLPLMIIGYYSFAQNHTAAANPNLVALPANLQTAVAGHYQGACTYQSQTKDFTLDAGVADGKPQFFWSIYQTGIVSKKISHIAYDTLKKQIVLDGFIFLSIDSSNQEISHCKIAMHTFLADFPLVKTKSTPKEFKTENITFNNKDVKLAGTIYSPLTKGPHPGIIFLHGSGEATRWEWAPFFAEKFAKLGFVSLIFDKRGCGESTGDWTVSSLNDLSDDATMGLKYLQNRGDVAKNKIGMWGFSNSGWVVANAENFTTNIAFLICVSGGAETPKQNGINNYKNALNQPGISDSDKDEAMALVNQYFDYLSNGLNREALLQNINAAKLKTWYKYLNIGRVVPSAAAQPNWSWVSNWDPLPSIEKIKTPILVISGENDDETDPKISDARWKLGLDKAGNTKYKIVNFKDANHGIRIGSHATGSVLFWEEFAPGYVDTLTNWMDGIGRDRRQ